MFEINLDRALEDLRKMNRDLAGAEFKKAVRLGLNDGIRRSRTNMVREVLANFNNTAFTPGGVRSALSIENATNNNLTAKLGVSGRPVAMGYFSPRKNKTGISVEIIKGQRKQIRSAFMVKFGNSRKNMPTGRGEYDGNQFNWRKKRINKRGNDLPISKLLSVSLPSAVYSDQAPIMQNVGRELDSYVLQRIEHHMKQIRLGNNR